VEKYEKEIKEFGMLRDYTARYVECNKIKTRNPELPIDAYQVIECSIRAIGCQIFLYICKIQQITAVNPVQKA